MRKRVFTEEEIQKVVYNYTVLKMGQKRAGKEFNMNDRMVKRLLMEQNIPIKSIQETNITSYPLNHNFFDIENEDMAYVLGMLASDGCIAQNENCIYIELQESDKEILEQINQKMQNGRPVKHYETNKGYKNCKLYFFSAHIKKRLRYYNLMPNKTYDENFNFPFNLDKKYWIDYIRGYFDGDGCVKVTSSSLTFQIDAHNRKVLEAMRDYFSTEHGIKVEICVKYPTENNKQTGNMYRLYCYGEPAKRIFELMYHSSDILKLKRKYNKYLEICKKK